MAKSNNNMVVYSYCLESGANCFYTCGCDCDRFVPHTNFVNCTPHEITIVGDDENIVIPKCENPTRVSTTRKQVSSVANIPVNRVEFGEITNLPEDCPPGGWHADEVDNFFIVSRIVAEAVKNSDLSQEFKNKFLVVDETVRNEAGHIIGCKSFARV